MLAYAKTHLFYIVLIAVGIIAFRSWLAEHDQRLQTTVQLAASQEKIKDLEDQIVAVNAAAQKQVQTVVKIVHDVATPQQAVAAIPQLTDAPLNARVSPDDPTQISVAAIPFTALLGQCKTDAIELSACTQREKDKDAIITEKTKDISNLKKPQNFWKRTLSTLKAVGIGIGIGAALSAHGL